MRILHTSQHKQSNRSSLYRSVLKTIHKCTCEQLKWQEMCTIGVSRQTSKLVPWGRGGPPVCPYGGPYELGLWDWLGAASSKGLETLMLSPAPWFGTPTPSSEVNKQWLAYTMLCASFSDSLSVQQVSVNHPPYTAVKVWQLNVK